MGIPNSVRYFQRLNEMVKELAKEVESEKKGEKMATNQSQYEEMCEVYERYNKGGLVPVVRCKDCKYFDHSDFGKGEEYWCKHFIDTKDLDYCLKVDEDGFCSRAERREDAIR